MTNILAVHSVGQSLIDYLRGAYPPELRASAPCDFALISSGEMAANADLDGRCTLYLYRAVVNGRLRSAVRPSGVTHVDPPLELDLHYLLTVWSKSAATEQTVLAWAMQQLQRRPILDRSTLSADADWSAAETIQLLSSEMTTDEMMRIWESLAPSYRVSVAYVARVVRIT
ncbi:MAG: DUF4255 domain-containing protein [Gemmatimonadaceae bacterium]